MLALQNNLVAFSPIAQEVSIIDKMLEKGRNVYKSYATYKKEQELTKITEEILELAFVLKNRYNSLRNSIKEYHINDIEVEEDYFCDILDETSDVKDLVENLLDKDTSNFKNNFIDMIVKVHEDLYEILVLLEFEISQKVANAYLENKTN